MNTAKLLYHSCIMTHNGSSAEQTNQQDLLNRMMDLNYPPGLELQELNKEQQDEHSIENKLLGLPGGLELDAQTSNKYFGYQAREVDTLYTLYHTIHTILIRDVASMGIGSISSAIAGFEDSLFPESKEGIPTLSDPAAMKIGTFAIHNLGMYGIKAAAPIVLSPQACALSLGAIADTVIPNTRVGEGEEAWTVAPVMTATMSCDHRGMGGVRCEL